MALRQEIMLARLQRCAGRGFTLDQGRRAFLFRRLPMFRDDRLMRRDQVGTCHSQGSSCPNQCPSRARQFTRSIPGTWSGMQTSRAPGH